MKQTLQKEGAFRIPVDLHLNQRRVLQASHSGEVHGVENFEGTRVVSARDHKAYPMNSVEPANRASLSVRLPPRLQRPGKWGRESNDKSWKNTSTSQRPSFAEKRSKARQSNLLTRSCEKRPGMQRLCSELAFATLPPTPSEPPASS